MSSLVYGQDERVGNWVKERVGGGQAWNGEFRAIGLERNGRLIAGVTYTDCSAANCCVHIASEGKQWCSRSFLAATFWYPFGQLGLRRITAPVDSTNTASINFVIGLGFVPEARLERMLPGGDLILFRMFSEDCKWVANRAIRRHHRTLTRPLQPSMA